MKILLPVDGSLASLNAAKKAVEIAEKEGYSIKMIFVVNDNEVNAYTRNARLWEQADGSVIDKSVKPIDENESINQLIKKGEAIMDTLISQLDYRNVEIDRQVLAGEPYEKILETAKKENVDLIVMGNRGFSKIKRFFVGSVTQRVIAEASIPVLVIHTDARD